jgi:hypothetical protein
MSTLKTTNIQHPDSPTPQIALSASGMTFSASALELTGGAINLPAGTSIGNVSSTELGYLDGVTSALQTQLNAKAPSTGIAQSAITNLTTDLAAKAPSTGIAQSAITNLTTDLAAKAPIASPVFTGTLFSPRSRVSGDGQDASWFETSGVVTRMSLGDLGAGAGLFEFNRSSGGLLVRASTTGGVSLGAGGTSWASASDENMKDITDEIDNASDAVRLLRAVYFTWKHDSEKTPHVGLIAQDVQVVLPEAVDKTEDGTLMLRYSDVIPLLVGAIKEQADQIDALITRIEWLEAGNEPEIIES